MKNRKKFVLTGLMAVFMLLALLPASALGAGIAFNDVNVGDWYYDAVQYVSENGLMTGVGGDKFAPADDVTRGMIVTILYRMEGSPEVSGTCPFGDVAADSWYEKGVTWAAANGIVNGYSADAFGPDDSVSREQMAAIFYRYADFKKFDVSKKADLSGFADAAKVSDWAADAMSWGNAVSLINGVGGNTLAPEDTSTRAQLAAILMRFEKNVAGKSDEPKPTPAPKPSSGSDSGKERYGRGHKAASAVKENVIAATCTEAGSYEEVIYCSDCGIELKRTIKTIPALGHAWDEGTVTKEPTCTEEGVKTFTCQNDPAHTKTETIAATGHKPAEAVKENEVAPTCTKKGSYEEVVYCSACGAELSRTNKTSPALGHAWDEGTVTKEPTCTEDGVKTFTCQNDPTHTKTEAIAAAGHKPAEAVKENEVAATCTKKGSYDEVVYCSVCQAELSRETKTVKKLGHDYKDGVCTVCGAKQQYKVTFVDYDKSVIATQMVAHGESAKAPADPKRDGYTFKGWDVAFDKIVAPLTVTAVYEEAKIDTDPTLVVSSVQAKPGDSKVAVTVTIRNNPGVLGMRLALDYDDSVLTLESAKNGAALSMLVMTKPGKFEPNCRFVWDGQELDEEDIQDGVVLTLTFSVSDKAKAGSYPISVSYNEGDIIDANMDEVAPKTVAGGVTVQGK